MAGWQRWLSPAKLNLGLRIIGRRADGYHLLQTLFQLIDLSDVIHLRRRDDSLIWRVSELPGVEAENDLAIRAARALQRHAGVTIGAEIHVRKRIPMGAGLGGGSSNAGTVLRALNRIWAVGMSPVELAELGAELGADVPVFALGRNAVGEGVGEQLTPVTLPLRQFVVICAPVQVPTAEVFADPRLTRNSLPSTIPRLLSDECWINDCESAVTARVAEVAGTLAWLRDRGAGWLTGTGAAVYAPVRDAEQAQSWLAELPSGWRGWLVSSLDEAPEGTDDTSFTVGTSPSW
ncbi:MAG: 4-(cytidine 5'-diphospho)-2-C-methyl-D-erythritol kinase [Xanthomonadales bacterium]|nr:4-(cytidine 5'-diphospho)-2-C-methyl-D-erythritol kinase [Xanthomonadales bacterium]